MVGVMNNKKNIFKLVVTTLILLTVFFGIIFFFGGTILLFLGLHYDSIWDLVKFFVIYLIIGIPLDFIIEFLFAILRAFSFLTRLQRTLLSFVIDVPINMVVVGLLQSVVDGVSFSVLTAFLFAVVCWVINQLFEKESKNEEL